MKVLQTLGRKGIFKYRRQTDGVYIDSFLDQGALNPPQITITHEEWLNILKAIENTAQGSFRLSGEQPFSTPPNQSLYELLTDAVPNPQGGWKWNPSRQAYVCAILEHEGTIDLYHGALGPDHQAIICLRKDIGK
ncbi:MAG: hypothetical protein CDV28_102190 [Candidatus Electronema aureum]|uniref:Uncharacterized protein n=1 Tax=Candidatus Electronema aureum TaxID=2005002 RepID=A0A521G4W0_9BACT|nr:MAG: hypothetical protein CDV28_102190 [Candidatus Electronema aureum]